MQLRNLFDDDDAVSPVIGVILMVAITVILAAVIATFVLGLGEQVSDTAPQASFDMDYEEGSSDSSSYTGSSCTTDGLLSISHTNGDTISGERLSISGASGTAGNWDSDLSGSGYSEVSAGASVDVCVNNDDTVNVNWVSQNGQDSSTLRTWSGPSA